MFPLNEGLLEMIPSAEDLSLAKLADKGMIMVDKCNTTHKFWGFLIEKTKQAALKNGKMSDAVRIFKGDCWQHLRKVWYGAVAMQLSKTL